MGNAAYVFKNGKITVKNGDIVNSDIHGRSFWINSIYNEELEKQVVSEVEKMFKQYYSVNFASYPVQNEYIGRSTPVNGVINSNNIPMEGK